MKTISYKDKLYPAIQAEGNAAQYAIPFAKKFCEGVGYDIGCNRLEWAFPGAQAIDLQFDDEWDAYNLPDNKVDYIFSSHCLEHLPDWVGALDYWTSKLKNGGVLFLYLPHYSQEYWRPWNNRKHIHSFVPETIVDYMNDSGYRFVFNSEKDLLNSFMVVGQKDYD
jgi:SAM-dependent methyltransferase